MQNHKPIHKRKRGGERHDEATGRAKIGIGTTKKRENSDAGHIQADEPTSMLQLPDDNAFPIPTPAHQSGAERRMQSSCRRRHKNVSGTTSAKRGVFAPPSCKNLLKKGKLSYEI